MVAGSVMAVGESGGVIDMLYHLNLKPITHNDWHSWFTFTYPLERTLEKMSIGDTLCVQFEPSEEVFGKRAKQIAYKLNIPDIRFKVKRVEDTIHITKIARGVSK